MRKGTKKPLRGHRIVISALAATAISVACANPSHALVTIIEDYQDVQQHCDTLVLPETVHEIGWGATTTAPPHPTGGQWPFPSNQELSSGLLGNANTPPCPATNGPGADPTVAITNLTGRAWPKVWYVADHDTMLTNFDGYVTSPSGAFAPGITGGLPGANLPTFKIDSIGANTPLVFESMTSDDIWEVGETWEFVIQDYMNISYTPEQINSLGLDSPNVLITLDSSGSIIVPEPSGAVLLLLGMVPVLRRRRR